MRRISLALALASAVAATGCGGSSAPAGSGDGKGTAGVDFTVTVNNQGPGTVTSLPAGIDCAPNTTCVATFTVAQLPVVLTATVQDGNYFNGWFGGCAGTGTCTLTGQADKYVVSYFSVTPQAHPNFNDPKDHVSAWTAGVLRCDKCHGAELQGQGMAPGCNACHATGGHDWPILASAVANQALNGATGHFAASGHNSGACARCHSSDGFRDFLGVDGTTSNIADVKYAGGDYTAASGPVCDKLAVPPVTENCWNDPTTAGKLGTTAQWYYASGYRCDACHNSATVLGGGTLTTHKFPSGNVLTLDGRSAICAQCHDGGRPTYEVAQVKSYLATAAATDLDAQLPAAQNKLVRAHYFPAASTLYGEEAGNWYEYAASCSKTNADGSPISTAAACTAATGTWTAPGTVTAASARNNYTARNAHGGVNSCTFCHDPHSGKLPYDDQVEAKCGGCHNDELTSLPVKSWVELEESRQYGFEGDIDGDGTSKALHLELDGLRAKLLVAIQNYATNVAGANICFDGENRFYAGTGVNGVCTAAEITAAVAYAKFTPRLLPATYNYLIATNDKGAWAHNPRYAIEIMYDAIADLNAGLVAAGKTASPNGNRAFDGHFGAAEDPSAYAAIIYHGATNPTTKESLPAMGFTSGACYQCHGGAAGFSAYLAAAPAALGTSVITDASKISAMECNLCHTYDGAAMKGIRNDIATVYFPGQKDPAASPSAGLYTVSASAAPKSFALCGSCHSGRENGASITNKITFAGTVAVGTATSISFATTPITLYGDNAFKGATLTFTSGANAGTSVAVTGGAKGVAPATNPTITWAAALTEAPAAGDTFTVSFADGTFALSFTNPHYLGAAGMMLGDDAKVMYQYSGKTYTKKPAFWGAVNGNAPGPHGSPHGAACTNCHQPKASKHEFGVDLAYCATCHKGQYDLLPIEEEYQEATAELLGAIDDYVAANLTAIKAAVVAGYTSGGGTNLANANAMTGVCYNAPANPYWFVRTGAGTEADPFVCSPTTFGKFDPKLLKAAFNYQWTQKEPGAWAHNEFYVLQAIYDSIVDLGGAPTFTVGNAYTPAAEKRP